MLSLFATSFRRRMLPLLALAPALSAAAPLRADPASLVFEGTKYVLISVDTAAALVVTNVYAPEGTTLATAPSLIGVIQWPSSRRVSQAVTDWQNGVASRLVQPAEKFKDNDPSARPDTVLLESWLSTPDPAVLEVNLWRFVSERGTRGVKAYYYLQRIAPDKPQAYVGRRGSHLRQLSVLKAPILLKPN